MGLNRFRNQPCPCKSGMKFKHCCLQDHYREQQGLVTPIQKKEDSKTVAYWRKRYQKVTTKPLDESLMLRDEATGSEVSGEHNSNGIRGERSKEGVVGV